MTQIVATAGSVIGNIAGKVLDVGSALPLVGRVFKTVKLAFGSADDQNIMSFFKVARDYQNVDFDAFLRDHRAALLKGQQTGDFVEGVCNYYKLMAGVITAASGPFWHFVPMTKGKTRKECHEKFHHTMVEYLDAHAGDKILEFGCGFGEIGRQVALISGASVTGLTMADEEIVGGTERIKRAGLEGRCRMVQGNYHKMPFEKDSFDKVFGVYTLKYSAQLDTAVAEAARVLKPGGRLVSYEILLTDTFDQENPLHKYYSDNISHSTCMPPLYPEKSMRAAAKKAGLVPVKEVDLCTLPGEGPWYSCFTRTFIFHILQSRLIFRLVKLAEVLRILPKGFAGFYDHCLVHPTTDFVLSGKMGIISGSIMMVWEKPKA